MCRNVFRSVTLAVAAGLLCAGLAPAQGGKKEIKATGWGSLTGKVTLEGDLPSIESLVPAMTAHPDKECCLAGTAFEKQSHKWVVDAKTRGVKNITLFLKVGKGEYFPIHAMDKKRTDTVVIDQPKCMFLPHVAAFYPEYYDGAKKVATGQKLVIKNSASVTHNTRGIGNPLINPGFNYTLPPKTEKAVSKLKAQPTPMLIQCDIHPWMNAKLFVFDHPYYAISAKDGSFSIPRVPAGVEITINGWHEELGWVFGRNGKQVTFKEGPNSLDFTVKVPK